MKKYLDRAQESRDISEYAYREGLSLLEFLDAGRRYRANQFSYRQALARYLRVLERLRQAAGVREMP